MMRPTEIAIPLFAATIAAEAWWARRSENGDYVDGKDAWTNILLGLGSVVWGAGFGLAAGVIYSALYEIAPYKVPEGAWWAWLLLFLIDDLFYYVFHRVSHRCRLFWNFHVVHHSSESYNLSVAVRQSWFSGIIHWIFYAPLMLFGFAPWMFAVTHGINLIYQFWIHTRLVGRLGHLESVLNTPSHHRVHHGRNDAYLDKNYAGVLIIWDRMFGSFVAETEEPEFGIIKPLRSYNALWINSHAWHEMLVEMKRRSGFWARMACIIGPPAMEPPPGREIEA